MLRRTTRRTGFSLTEVIVALFVMAVGIISLLTLFPVGAVQMGLALRDDRSQTTALEADATLRMWWQQQVVESFPNTGQLNREDVPFWVMDDPNDPWAGGGQHPGAVTLPGGPGNYTFAVRPAGNTVVPRSFPLAIPQTGAGSEQPSYPVLIDPIGFQSYTTDFNLQFWMAGSGVSPVPANQFAIPRRTLRTIGGSLTQAIRTCTLFDDIEFSREGSTGTAPGFPADQTQTGGVAPVVRYGRFNWAAIVQRQNNGIRTVADLKILVYDRRAPGIAPSDAELAFTNVAVAPGSTQIVLPATLDVLKLRVNGWIMDGTIDLANNVRNAHFYRIQSLTENIPVPGQTTVELQTPIRPATGNAGLANYNAQIYVLSNLIDVYDRPQLVPSNYLQQVP